MDRTVTVELSYYLVSDTTYTDDHHISNELRHVFWFPAMAVAEGDFMRLMTKAGMKTSALNDRQTKTHTLYWGLGRKVWNKDGDCAVLFKLEAWKTKRA